MLSDLDLFSEQRPAANANESIPVLTLEDRAALVGMAQHLVDVQIDNMLEKDYRGFNNADVFIGDALAAAVSEGYASDGQARYLALLVAQKYREQSSERLSPECMARLVQYGTSAPDRSVVKSGLAEPLSVARREDGAFVVKAAHRHNYHARGLNVIREASGISSVGRLVFKDAASCAEFLQRVTGENSQTRVVGAPPTPDEIARDAGQMAPEIRVERIDERHVRLNFDYDAKLVATVKALPDRRFDGETKSWVIPSAHLPQAIAALDRAGARTDALRALVPDYEEPEDLRFPVSFELKGTRIRFPDLPYDPYLVEAFRAVPSARFDRDTKAWSIDVWDAPHVQPAFRDLADRFNVDAFLAYKPPALQAEAIAQIPPEKAAVLRDYQRVGVERLLQPLDDLRRTLPGGRTLRGCVVGDEMGLGKTIQAALAADALTDPDSRVLIICPASLKLNWRKEIHKWVGADASVCVVGAGKGIDADARWVVINYDIVPKFYDEMRALKYDVVVLDEAHYIKNPKAIRSLYTIGGTFLDKEADKRVKIDGLCAYAQKRVFPMTGTPIPNRMRDSFQLWRAIGHPVAANKHVFEERFCNGHHEYVGRKEVWVNDGATNVEELREIVAPVFLQRKKSDVLSLPPKVREFVPVEIDQREYRKVMDHYRAKGNVGGECALECLTQQRMATGLAKVPATVEFISNCIEQGEKVIVFSKSTRVLDAIEKKMEKQAVVRLDGSMSQGARERAVEQFQGSEAIRVFLGQVDAAGVGLTLTAANRVVFNDMDWLPGNLLQAEDRAHRIGQDRHLNVTYLVADGTFDDDIADSLQGKLDVVTTFEGRGNAMLDELKERLATRLGFQLNAPAEPALRALI